MPELPEVETTRRGIAPWLEGRRVSALVVRNPDLRWPVPPELSERLVGARIAAVQRRAKYLLLRTGRGTALLHLGMTGSLRIIARDPQVPRIHDHVDLVTDTGITLRFTDPRRFGSLLWTDDDPALHPLIAPLGPEPLGPDFNAGYLIERSARRKVAIKAHLMNARIVVGVGNIYANEALFRAGIRPGRAAGRVSPARLGTLVDAVKDVLEEAIHVGGTTLRDFSGSDGEPGYFAQSLRVYDRAGAPCIRCAAEIRHAVLGQRSSYFCPRCQT